MPDSSPTPDAPKLPILGSYRIIRQLGSGGMSSVFQAVHEQSDSLVALKVLPKKLAQNPTLLARFLKEAKSAEALDHPNIVAIYDRGFDQGRHYLVLEFVDGRDLHEVVRGSGPIEPTEAIRLLRQIAGGLKYAAGQGMIHRDIKPANLLRTVEGDAKIIDLGLALQSDDEDERVTRDGTTVGTVDYMSPEQARDSRRIGLTSDIYSLGCSMYFLLTGSAPFPGGSLADKLARHYSAAVPDVREKRPEVSVGLAHCVARMMAKKPDGRFADYDQLIAGLDRISAGLPLEPSPPASVGSFDVVVVDDEDDPDDAVPMASFIDEPRETSPPANPSRALTSNRAKKGKGQGRAPAGDPTPVPEFSLKDLAELEDAPATPRKLATVRPDPAGPEVASSDPVLEALFDEEDDEEGVEPMMIRRAGDELPLRTWIFAGVAVGLMIALVAFGASTIFSALKKTDEPITKRPETPDLEPVNDPLSPDLVKPAANPRTPAPLAGSNPKPVVVSPPAGDPTDSRQAPTSPVPTQAQGGGQGYPAELTSRLGFLPDVAAIDLGNRGGTISLLRLADPANDRQTSSVGVALNRGADDLAFDDVGPFMEDNFSMAGRSRVIRGRESGRTILKIESTGQQSVREQPAKFVLGGTGVEQLVFERIDLVVDVRDLPSTQNTLFLCQGAELVFRDCTLTVANVADRRGDFSIIRLADGPRSNRLVLDRTLVRGPVQTFVDLSSARSEVVLSGSVVSGGSGPLISLNATKGGKPRFSFDRSVLISQGAVFHKPPAGVAPTIRSLGTTFARAAEAPSSPFFDARNLNLADLDWDGDDNQWFGWSGLTSSASPDGPTVLASIRRNWPGAETSSREGGTPWPPWSVDERMEAINIAKLIGHRESTLAKVATPHASIFEMTIDQFPKVSTPAIASDSGAWGRADRPVVSLSFDARVSPVADFGTYLRDQVKDAAGRYLVRVQGGGAIPMSAVELPEGCSVSIVGDSTEGSNAPFPIFTAKSPGRPMISVRKGDLSMANLGFAADGDVRPSRWMLIDSSVVAIQRCRYRDGSTATSPVADPPESCVEFIAREVEPIEPNRGGLASQVNRPTLRLENCWIWTTGGVPLLAEMARGSIWIDNSILVGGDQAIRLKPASADPARFDADLTIDHSTLAADRYIVAVDPWPGSIGPARPWLITSRASAFPRGSREGLSALLGVDPSSFKFGPLFWQSSADLYEVNRFLTPVGTSMASPQPSADLKRNWIDLWGINHTRADRGPDPRRAEHVIRFLDKDRPRLTRPTVQNLALDPKVHKDQGPNQKKLPN